MDTKIIEWSKTILLTHAITPRLLNAITKENEKMTNMGFGSKHFNVGQNTYDFLESMLKVNIRRRHLVEMYNVVNEILKDMDKEERRILEDRFFARRSVASVLSNLNIRTAYRRYNSALTSFGRELISRGYTAEILENAFADDKVVSAIHTRVINHSIVFRNDEEPIHNNIIKMNRVSNMTVLKDDTKTRESAIC